MISGYRRPIFSFLAVHVCARVTLGVAHAERNIGLARRCNELQLRHVFGHAGNAGNECADGAASLGMRGFISENNVPDFGPREFCARLL